MESPNSLYLQHYGVKGMKWGVRKARYDTPAINSARANLRAEKQKLRSTRFGSRGAQRARVDAARSQLRGEKAKARYGGSLNKYSAKRVGELQSVYGRGAVRRLAKNTKRAQKGKLGVGSVKDQERREMTKRVLGAAAGLGVTAYVMSPKGQAKIMRGAEIAAPYIKRAMNAARGSKAPSQAVRNLQPIANLPAATKRLRGR